MSKEIKVCDICKKDIKKEENYYLLQSYREGVYIGRKFYHWKCFDEYVSGMKDIETIKKEAREILGNAKKMMEYING